MVATGTWGTAAPPVTPPANEHPRVMFTKDDISTIKANLTNAENVEAYEAFNDLKGKAYDGFLPETTNNYSADGLAIIEAKAFDYVINGNTENGEAAVTDITFEIPADADVTIYKVNVAGLAVGECRIERAGDADSTTDATVTAGQTATGDNSNLALRISLLVLGFIGAIAGIIYREKF